MTASARPVPVRSSIPRARAAVGVAMDIGLRPAGHGVARFRGSFQHVLGALDAKTRPLARR